jgi:hypothetical protein
MADILSRNRRPVNRQDFSAETGEADFGVVQIQRAVIRGRSRILPLSGQGVTATADVRFGEAIPGQFIAMAPSDLTFAQAGAYCSAQGGRIPLIKRSNFTTAKRPVFCAIQI